jgi:hypothetical protein
VTEELVAAAGDALERVRVRHGADPGGWRWAEVHRARWRYPLSAPKSAWLDVAPVPAAR